MTGTVRDRTELVQAITRALGHNPDVAAAYLYGSAARATTTALSDVDVAVLLREGISGPARAEHQRRYLDAIGRQLPGMPVDVRFFDELPLAIRGRVLRDGVRAVDRDPPRRVREEVRTLMEYHDFLFFERAGTAQWVRGVRERLGRG